MTQQEELKEYKRLQKILKKVHHKFGGCGQVDHKDRLWSILNCNGFETVQITHTHDEECIPTIKVSDVYYDRGSEIREYINTFI